MKFQKGNQINKDRKHTEAQNKAQSERMIGHKQSEVSKQKISIAMSNLVKLPEVREKIRNTLKGRHISPETEFKKGINPITGFKEGNVPWNKGKPFLQKENHPNWKGGISFDPYCPKFNFKFKESVRIRDEHTCQLCGSIQNDRRHHVHHIHYLKSDCYPDCITLCCSCNIKANTNRSYWENLFMNKLNDRQLLFWTRRNIGL